LKRAQLFEIFEYLPSPISCLFNRMTPIFTLATTPSNQQNQRNMESSASSKDSKRSLIWSHLSQIGLDNTNMIRSVCSFETNDNYSIQFKISNKSSTILFKMKKKHFAQHCRFVFAGVTESLYQAAFTGPQLDPRRSVGVSRGRGSGSAWTQGCWTSDAASIHHRPFDYHGQVLSTLYFQLRFDGNGSRKIYRCSLWQ